MASQDQCINKSHYYLEKNLFAKQISRSGMRQAAPDKIPSTRREFFP